ncbi:radical SAM protein [Patescibacteria group bacterium]|nr:radical SAM protein [Patescibacteria group bacterium]
MRIKSVGWGFGICNMNCKHCYGASGASAPEYTFRELQAIADKICHTIQDINYGTGEFAFNPNAVALAEYIKDRFPHIKQAVTSNGATPIFMRPDLVKKLFHDIDISLDFADPERHKDFRQHPLAWKWVEESLALCRDLEIERSIVSCITSQTTDDIIKELLEFSAKHGATWRTNWFRKTGRGKSYLEITPQRFWEIIVLLAKESAEFVSLSDPLLASILGRPDKNPTKGCPCGELSCRIQTDLTVTPCVYLKGKKWSGGSIQEKTLEEIYHSEKFEALRNRYPAVCRDCKFGETCRGGCASRAYLHTGSLDNPDNYCPIVAGMDVEELVETIQPKALTITPGTDLVHDGYLCTMIIKQK